MGSGKSALAEVLARCGAEVIDADQLARSVVRPGSPGLESVVRRFGKVVLTDSGELDRTALARIVFNDPAERRALEGLLHPLIRAELEGRLAALAISAERSIVVYMAPLLFESQGDLRLFDLTVTVSAPEDQAIARIVARDRCTAEEARRRRAAQLSDSEKERRATITVVNDGTLEELSRRGTALYRETLKRAAAQKIRR